MQGAWDRLAPLRERVGRLLGTPRHVLRMQRKIALKEIPWDLCTLLIKFALILHFFRLELIKFFRKTELKIEKIEFFSQQNFNGFLVASELSF